MTILLGFLGPLVVYMALLFLVPRKRLGAVSLVATALIALISSATVMSVFFFSEHWSKGTQIAWTGVSATGKQLSIGGPQEQALVGWPNGSFAPLLRVSGENTAASIELTQGRAFALDEDNNVLNGEPIKLGESRTFGSGRYTIRVYRYYLFWRRIEVLSVSNEVLADFGSPNEEDRAYSLSAFIAQSRRDARTDLNKLSELDALEDWSADVRLLFSSKGEVRVLEKTNESRTTCTFPCRMSLVWANNQKLQISIEETKGGIALKFLPLWRYSSPIPPLNANQESKLVVTGYARPDDVAFLLPLGHGIRDPRETITLSTDQSPVFTSPGAIVGEPTTGGNLPSVAQPPRKIQPDDEGVTSRIAVPADSLSFSFATVTNGLPRSGLFLVLWLIAFLTLVGGLFVAYPRVTEINLWVLYGLVAVIWNLLVFRLLLSLRYSFDPTALDRLTVQGVTVAFVGVAIVPGLVFLSARLRCDWFMPRPAEEGQRKAFRYATIYLIALGAGFWVEYFLAPRLWTGLPSRFVPSLGMLRGVLFVLAFLILFLYLLGSILFLYSAEPSGKNISSLTHRLFLKPWVWVENFTKNSSLLWEQILKGRSRRQRLRPFIHLALFWGIFTPLFLFLIFRLFPHLKVIEEFSIPIIFCWPFAIFWLSSRLRFTAGSEKRGLWKALKSWQSVAIILCAFLTIIPPLLLPFVAIDSGSVLAVIAIFIPLVCILLITASRYGWTLVIGFSLIVFVIASMVYPNLEYFSSILHGKSQVRLLTFKEGDAIQKYMLFASAAKGRGLPLQDLQNSYQHTWENKAIAHEGDWRGMGFGNAPTRRSNVRQDTIQFDSVFSFFVVSEYGIVGGVSLLFLYAIPLIVILLGGRFRFDLGYGIACVVAGSFFLEALFHAGMNLEAFPFSGRNLPFLSVNSISDLLRWTVLFCFAAQTIFWRYLGKGDYKDEAVSIISSERSQITQRLVSWISRFKKLPRQPVSEETEPPNNTSAAWHISDREDSWSYWKAVALISVVPAFLLLKVGWNGYRVAADQTLGNPFGYEQLLSYLQKELIDKNRIVLEPQTLKISPVQSEITVSDEQLIAQEIARFNALPDQEKVEGATSDDYKVIVDDLKMVSSLTDYDRVINHVRERSLLQQERHRVNMFALKKETNGQYRLIANPDYNVRLSFKVNVAQTSFRDGKTRLIGPAWVMGRWVATYDPNSPLPWISDLAQVLNAQWSPDRLGAEKAQKNFGVLTLDQKLQEAAMRFMAEKGRQLHGQLLSNKITGDAFDKLPPRVALAIVGLSDGGVLALGSWPRMTPGRFWRRGDGNEWIPPVDWLRRDAPQALRLRYEGDRNFDRGLVMGSSTKPLWATAVLAVHPGLDQRLRVRGSDLNESDVFGIRLSGTWGVKPTLGWVDFRTYLRKSDNRYHVRLGFLGLAEKAGSNVTTDAGTSKSVIESMDGMNPWRKYPAFPSVIGFSKDRPNAMENLHQTALAVYLRNMYSIGISKDDPLYRFSFWTKNEDDDTSGVNNDFRSISPQAVNFAFDALPTDADRIQSPRDYITRLLGGGTNLWANVDFAGAFGACITGHPVLIHIVNNQETLKISQSRQNMGVDFPAIAAKLRPGLEDVVMARDGTARTHLSNEAIALLEEWRKQGIRVYAKTGTLEAEKNSRETSRIVLTLVRWNDEGKGLVQSGLVFSMVGEDAQVGKATEWLGEFLIKNRSLIEGVLS